ncbi:MAG: IS607 family transposase [Acholeplasmatales bacterium]|nr:IS607 family transposase [Acholeplasmatales bacterium]
MKYYSSKTVTEILGVTAQTLRNWDKNGKLKPAYVKSNGYRYYSEDSILSFTNQKKHKIQRVIGYARVSSKKQSDDLERQVDNLKTYLNTKYQDYEIITDIGSGINFTKPGLKKLIEKINKREIDIIVVLYKDRLLRFGFELVEYFAKINNVEIEVLDKKDKNEDQELVEDLVQIINEVKGKRKTKIKLLLNEFSQKLEKSINN